MWGNSVDAQAGHQPGQRALPALHSCDPLQDSAHTASALGVSLLCWPPSASPKGSALLSQPSPAKSTALSILYKVTQAQPLPHCSCETWHQLGGVCLGIFCAAPRAGASACAQSLEKASQGPWAPEQPLQTSKGAAGCGDSWENVHHGCLGPAEASSNSRLASQQGHSPCHLPSSAHRARHRWAEDHSLSSCPATDSE